jgi:cellobiose phosphorylase
MKHGHFSPDGLEYIITNPETPRPWINYLTNKQYCSIISQCAGGYSFYKDCRTNRITRWLPENWHFDRPGKYIYAREKAKYWALTYQPLRVNPRRYECRHGLGYTNISSLNNGIDSEVVYFVPEHDDCEVWLVSIKNITKKNRTLELYPYIEFLIGDYHEELRYRNIMNLYNRVWFDKDHNAVFAKKTAQWQGMNIQPFDTLLFFASSLPVKGCCTQKDAFLGPYNTEEKPDAILKGTFKNFHVCSGEDGIGSFKHIVSLKPGQTKEFSVILGQTSGIPEITKILSKYRDIKTSKKELQQTKDIWRERITNNIHMQTPDKDFNTFFNVWGKYQMYICNFWSRSPG